MASWAHHGPNGGVTIDNPNEPASVQRMDVQELAALRSQHGFIDCSTFAQLRSVLWQQLMVRSISTRIGG